MEKHKRYLVFLSDDNYTLVAEFDHPNEVQDYILLGGHNIHDLLVTEFLPINITIGYPYEEL